MNVQGHWVEGWAPVVAAFAENFTSTGEEGAGLALYHRQALVVNIWAGKRNNQLAGIDQANWNEQTYVNLFSAGKGLVALCILQLVAEGKLALDRPVANYWPEFIPKNKSITLRQILCHRAGLSAFHPVIPNDQIFEWPAMIAMVATDQPWWAPGTAQGYSPFIFGWVLGELVRRVSGYASFDAYFQARVAQPLGISCYFGVPDNLLSSVADTGPLKRPLGSNSINLGADSIALGKLMKSDPRGVTNRAFANPISLLTAANSQSWRQAQIPAANAHANAPALATIYGVLANNDARLLDDTTRPLCWEQLSFEEDRVLGLPLRFSHGFMLSQANRADCRYGRGTRSFGHPGAGGCVGFADPDYHLGFGYVTHRMGQSLLIDERASRLIDATYQVLEHQYA